MKSDKVSVDHAISNCYKDVPEKDSQGDPAAQMNSLKKEYEKLVKEYKAASKKSDEKEDEIEEDSIELEEDGDEIDFDEKQAEINDEGPQNGEKYNDEGANESINKNTELDDGSSQDSDDEVISKRSIEEDSAKDRASQVKNDEADKDPLNNSVQSVDEISNEDDELNLPDETKKDKVSLKSDGDEMEDENADESYDAAEDEPVEESENTKDFDSDVEPIADDQINAVEDNTDDGESIAANPL